MNRTSRTIANSFWTALLAASLLGLGATGCDKSSSKNDDEAEAESPEKSGEAKTDASGGERLKERAKQQKMKNKVEQGAARGEMEQNQGEDIEVTNRDLENFARVQIRMQEYAKSEGMTDKKPKGKKQKIQMMMKMKKKAQSVMEDIGMETDRYTKIGRKMKSNPQLQQRLNAKVEELQSEEGGADSSESP